VIYKTAANHMVEKNHVHACTSIENGNYWQTGHLKKV